MTPEEIKAFWNAQAATHGTHYKATTKGETIKRLEIARLARWVEKLKPATVLEAGCGNGQNLAALSDAFPDSRLSGFDYSSDMVSAAIEAGVLASTDDVLRLARTWPYYDLVFTDRLLINIFPPDREIALRNLAALVRPGGHLLLIENFVATHARQNMAREAVGLPARPVVEHNKFLYEWELPNMNLIAREDFGALHDIMLYVLVPLMNGGTVDYGHPLVEAATQLSLALGEDAAFGTWGQNRLYVFRKEA